MFCAKSTYFIRIDKMYLHISIKFTHKDKKFIGIAINLFLIYLMLFVLAKNLFEKKHNFLARRKDFTRID